MMRVVIHQIIILDSVAAALVVMIRTTVIAVMEPVATNNAISMTIVRAPVKRTQTAARTASTVIFIAMAIAFIKNGKHTPATTPANTILTAVPAQTRLKPKMNKIAPVVRPIA